MASENAKWRSSLFGTQSFPDIAWRPLLLILASVALFAILLPLAGLAMTSFALVVCAGFAAYDVRLRENAIAAAVLAVFAIVLFIVALGLPIPVWPW